MRVYGLGEETSLLYFLGQPEPNGVEKIIEISVKSGKDRVGTPTLVIHRVRLKKKPAKKYISIQGGGGETRKPSILMVSPCLSFFLSASTADAT
jgi:hypothetical protein